MTLVLALTVAAFTGMVRDAVVRGETAVSWQATGADVVVAASGQLAHQPGGACARSPRCPGSGGPRRPSWSR